MVLTGILGVLGYMFLRTPLAGNRDAAAAQPQCQAFTETNKTVCGIFLSYWTEHGGVQRQGLPISNAFPEVSEIDGKRYTVQYFERAVFEHHPENQPPFDLLISLLGTIQYNPKYPNGVEALDSLPAGMKPEGGSVFPQTGKGVRGIFLDYWLNNGGTLQYGYPISEAFIERSQIDGVERIVQYFERSVFEYHPENQPPYDVQVALLGRFRFERKYPNGEPGLATPTLAPGSRTDKAQVPGSGTLTVVPAP